MMEAVTVMLIIVTMPTNSLAPQLVYDSGAAGGAALCSAGALKDQDNQGTVLCTATGSPKCPGTAQVDSTEDCCKLCSATAGCVWWVYNTGGAEQPNCKVFSSKGLNTASLAPEGEVTSGPLVRVGSTDSGGVPGGGLGWGVFLLLLIGGGAVLYLTGGLIQYQLGSSGSRLPHAQFWADLPALVQCAACHAAPAFSLQPGLSLTIVSSPSFVLAGLMAFRLSAGAGVMCREGFSFSFGKLGVGVDGGQPLFEDITSESDDEAGEDGGVGKSSGKKKKKSSKKDQKGKKDKKGGKGEKADDRSRRKSAPAMAIEDRGSSGEKSSSSGKKSKKVWHLQ